MFKSMDADIKRYAIFEERMFQVLFCNISLNQVMVCCVYCMGKRCVGYIFNDIASLLIIPISTLVVLIPTPLKS